MNYDEAMDYIKSTAKFGSNLGLERTEKILELLGNPHKKLKCIHVAGTNGKGSTTAMIADILKESGYKVGMYTSPYILEFEERIQINGKNIPKDDLSKLITEVADAVNRVYALGYDHPTEFEIITCAAFLYYYREKVDYAVMEVGLGGRLDSTNVLVPLVSVITSISYDHMHILGNTLSEIAYEKAGIIKNGVPVVVYPQEAEAFDVIERVCRERNAPLIKVPQNCVIHADTGSFNIPYQNISITTEIEKYDVELSLLGKHQLLNCATAVHAVEVLVKMGAIISKGNILNALKKVKWIGRMEILRNEPLVVIDGAHNIDGITRLKESVESYFKYNKLVLIIGILADKQVENMIRMIAPMAWKVITVAPHSERAESALRLKEIVARYNNNVEYAQEYSTAYQKGMEYCNADDMLLVCGSLYMIGDMRKVIKN